MDHAVIVLGKMFLDVNISKLSIKSNNKYICFFISLVWINFIFIEKWVNKC